FKVARVELAVNGALVSTVTAPPYRVTLPLDAPVGTAEVRATAVDSGGNRTSAVAAVQVLGDSTPPTVAITRPISGPTAVEGAALHFAATAADDVDVDVDLYLNGQRIQTRGIAPFTFDLTVPRLQAGQTNPLAYQLVARDSRGQTASAAPVHITVLQDRPPT